MPATSISVDSTDPSRREVLVVDCEHDSDAADAVRKPMIERRCFIRNAGAALSATMAGSAAVATIAPPHIPPPAHALEDAEAIRKLHYTLIERVNAAQLAQVAELFAQGAEVPVWADPSVGTGPMQTHILGHWQLRDEIDVSPDRRCATAKFHCLVRTQFHVSSPLLSLTEMARLQGGGSSQRWETGVFEADFSRTGGKWLIARLVYRPDITASALQPNTQEA